MAIVKLLQYPDPRLRRKGKKVEKVDDTVRKVIDDMFETHYAQENCAALAATQLDFEEPLAITVIDFSPNHDQPLCLVNPEIFYREGEQLEREGCMSLDGGFYENVRRAMKIKVRALDRDGKEFEMEAEGFMAKCIQHEVDHLHGKVFIDHLSTLKRSRLLHKYKQYNRKAKNKDKKG